MTAKEAAELLDLIENRAEALARRGVRRVDLGPGVGFSLDAPMPEPAEVGAAADVDRPTGALDDSATYGLPGESRRIPRRTRTPLLTEPIE